MFMYRVLQWLKEGSNQINGAHYIVPFVQNTMNKSSIGTVWMRLSNIRQSKNPSHHSFTFLAPVKDLEPMAAPRCLWPRQVI